MFVETEKAEMASLRSTQRVLARIRLNVSGKINDEIAFEEESFTIAVNAAGGLLRLRNAVRKGQSLSLTQAKTGQRTSCTVAHVEPIAGGFSAVRVHFVEPQPGFWHIWFPPDNWTPRHADSKFNRRSIVEDRKPVSA